MAKIALLDDASLEVFLAAGKPSRRSITATRRKEKEKKERGKNSKIEKPKGVGHLTKGILLARPLQVDHKQSQHKPEGMKVTPD